MKKKQKEMKNDIVAIKNSIESIKSRLEEAEDRISELEDKINPSLSLWLFKANTKELGMQDSPPQRPRTIKSGGASSGLSQPATETRQRMESSEEEDMEKHRIHLRPSLCAHAAPPAL
ncbi:hypothetical protein QTO34_018191 [Cnephaeus nilssonii]|uniref:Uncharacterized protein n=1 Tax=Cnephaeus nilssonii TaxID=3371016 RepID=A0AA40HYE3_CNENI|nr:hypothetical protein QTO34_018191 [Eptesicus nilssonii]